MIICSFFDELVFVSMAVDRGFLVLHAAAWGGIHHSFPKIEQKWMAYVRSPTNVDYPPRRDPPDLRQLSGEGRVRKVQAE